MKNQPETNWPKEINELEKRTRKLLEKKDEHHQKEELIKLKNLKLPHLDGAR